MFDDESARLLTNNGFSIGRSAVREDGCLLVRINDIFMFPQDAEDLAHGRATIEAILERNEGKIFPGARQLDAARPGPLK